MRSMRIAAYRRCARARATDRGDHARTAMSGSASARQQDEESSGRLPPLRQLAACCLLWSTAGALEPPALHLLVAPIDDDSTDAPGSVGHQAASLLPTLEEAQRQLRAALAQGSRDAVIELLPGSHRVPEGGLVITAEDSPSEDRHAVVWKGSAGSALSGGSPVTGWTRLNDPSLPTGLYIAPAPPSLPNGTARHLYVDGVRAARTRVNTSVILGTVPGHPTTPNLALEKRPECPACSYVAKSSWPLSWDNPSDVEFVYPVGMSEPRCTVESVEVLNASTNTTRIVMKQ
eukprot:COSAG02_NODE_5186_length_4558_cov_15.067728_1_plen_289_part_00